MAVAPDRDLGRGTIYDDRLERMERRLWLALYGVAAAMASEFFGLLMTLRVEQ